MKTTALITLLLAISMAVFAQKIQLTDASDHYQSLQRYSGEANPERAWMDTIQYPPSEYGNSIVYLLVKPNYLTDNQVEGLCQKIKVPANSSDQVRKELDYLLQLQNERTPEQIKRVEYLANIGYWPSINLIPSHPYYGQNLKDLFFEARTLMGEDINAGNFPKISKLLQGIMQDMRVMEFTVKYKFFRPRPYHLEPKLQPLTKINSPSFVSGHTLWAFLQAFVWREIVPEKGNDFVALAEEIRRSREIMGIHYPSDNETARQLAHKMLEHYFRNESFRKDLNAAAEEWKSVSGKHLK